MLIASRSHWPVDLFSLVGCIVNVSSVNGIRAVRILAL